MEAQHEIFEMEGHPGEWVVQSNGPDGEIYRAIFDYSNAKQRAEEYAAWKYKFPSTIGV